MPKNKNKNEVFFRKNRKKIRKILYMLSDIDYLPYVAIRKITKSHYLIQTLENLNIIHKSKIKGWGVIYSLNPEVKKILKSEVTLKDLHLPPGIAKLLYIYIVGDYINGYNTNNH